MALYLIGKDSSGSYVTRESPRPRFQLFRFQLIGKAEEDVSHAQINAISEFPTIPISTNR